MRRVADSSELGDVVFSHPKSYDMVNAYPQVLIIDCTYSTNRYNMPLLEAVGATSTNKTFTIAYAFMAAEREDNFRYVLQFIKGLYAKALPYVIVADRDYALMNAVDAVFEEPTRRMLCRRHIEQCVLQQACKQPGFNNPDRFKHHWNKTISARTVDDFNQRWEEFTTRYRRWRGLIDYCYTTWISPHREHFASPWVDNWYHFGNYTTNRYIIITV